MNRRLLSIVLLLLVAVPAWAGTVNFQVNDHTGNNGIGGVAIAYNDYGSHYVSLGTTNASGFLNASVPDGTWNFRATKNYSKQYELQTVSATPAAVTFQTALYTVHVKNSTTADFAGINVYYNDYSNHWIPMQTPVDGKTDANGKAYIELFPGTYTFEARKNYSKQSGNSDGTSALVLQTAQFAVQVKNSTGAVFAGINVYYNDYSNHWIPMQTPVDGKTDANGMGYIELFPGTYTFKASKNYSMQSGTSDGSSPLVLQTAQFAVQVKNSTGAAFAGINVYYNDYSNHWIPMQTPVDGKTDANGMGYIELFPGTYTFKASKNYSMQSGTSDGSAPAVFQTAKATTLVKDCDTGTPIAGIGAYYNDYSNHWFNMGVTDANGESSIELFPSAPSTTFGFKARTIYTEEIKQVALTAAGATTEFNPTRVCFNYSGTVKYNDYSNHWYTMSCGTYMFPGTYDFKFGTTEQTLAIAGCSYVKTPVLIRLVDHNGNGLAGGVASYYQSGWKTAGTTDASGNVFTMLDGMAGNLKFRMTYAGASQSFYQNVSTNSTVVFQTELVSMKLLSSTNTVLAGTASYYASGWKTFGSGNTTTTMELLPVNYKFRVAYGGASTSKYQHVGTDPDVVFNTVNASMKLLASDNSTEMGGSGSYYASGWKTFGSGTTTTTMELLPVNYKFRVAYGGASTSKYQNLGSDPNVVFNLVSVTMTLRESDNITELAGAGSYYASGWKTFGTTTTSIDMLPVNYKFRVSYGGASKEKYQHVGNDPHVIFNTVSVSMKLLASDNSTELAGAGSYYASGWKTFGTTTASLELLPVNYKFRVGYGGASKEKYQDVSSDPNVVFNTVAVTMKLLSSTSAVLSGTGSYYASGWKPFGTTTSTIDMLPVNYKFRVAYGGASVEKYQNVSVDPVVVFNTVKATMKLLSGTTELAGASSYYASGWKTFGGGTTTTDMELLPKNYKFRVNYGGSSMSKYQDIGVDPLVIFTGTSVTLHFSGNITYYASGWKTFAKPTMSLLPGTYKFRFAGTGHPTVEKYITIAGNSMEKSIAYIRLISSTGSGIGGATAKYYKSGWKTVGTTASNGVALAVIDGSVGNLKYRMEHGGAAVEKYQNLTINSFVIFQTVLASMKLVESDGLTVLNGGTQYYASGWKTFGSGTSTTTMELLPVNLKFKMSYGGAAQEKYQNLSTNPDVVFQTTLVEMKLIASDNTTVMNGGTQYYAGGWKTFGSGTSTTTMELLPLQYKFKMSYGGAAIEKYQKVNLDPNVLFQTKLATFTLKASDNSILSGGAKYYASGWKDFGTGLTGSTMELLPLNYQFQVTHRGAAQAKYQNISSNANIMFQTVKVTMKLRDMANVNDLAGGTSFYASGWKTFGTGTSTCTDELLPLQYQFKIAYGGATTAKYQNVSSNPVVVFQTGQATSTCHTQYYASGWKTFTSGMEMLPGKYQFKSPTLYGTVVAGTSIALPGCAPKLAAELEQAPEGFAILGNYPNPFNPTTTISYAVPEESGLRIAVYNALGELVAELLNDNVPAGIHQVTWDAANAPSGSYFVRMTTGDAVYLHSMQLIR